VVSTHVVGLLLKSLQAFDVKPRKEQIPKRLTWEDTPIIEIPDLVGMTKKDLQEQLVDLVAAYNSSNRLLYPCQTKHFSHLLWQL
jgi:hypothetical protein